MTNAIVYVLKGLLAVALTLGNTFLMTPIWLYSSVTRKRTSSACPNALQNYLTFIARAFLYWLTVIGTQPSLNTRTPSRLRDRVLCRLFTWIEPASAGLLSRENGDEGLNEDKKETGTSFSPINFDQTQLPIDLEERELSRKTAALWFFNPKEPATLPIKNVRQSNVVLYFHGGAYITLEAGDIFMGLTLGRMQAKHAKLDVLSVNYRLAPGSKYPSQLFEAFSAWTHLRRLGYSQIFLGGDSAGANLALMLWRYLHDVVGASDTVPGLILHSPWLDLEGSKRESFAQKTPQCVISPAFVDAGLKAIQKSNIPSAQDPWLSPLFWPQATVAALPSLFVSNGGAEAILEEGCEFVERAKGQGVKVEHIIVDGHPHDFAAMFWFAPSTKRLFASLSQWVQSVHPSGEV